MTTSIRQPELQNQSLRLYGELMCRGTDWPGKLALAAFAGAADSGLSAAASIAGAACLVVDSNAAAMKAHYRDGAFDFVVNTLDEALRALKNEIRQRRPIAIGLIAAPVDFQNDAEERGLAADFVISGAAMEDSPALREWLEARHWHLAEIVSPQPSSHERTYRDVLPEDDVVRRRWMDALPTYQRSVRHGSRIVWLTAEEQRTMRGGDLS